MAEHPVNRARLLKTFIELVQIDAPSRKEGPILRHVTAILESLGARIVVDDAGERLHGETGNLIAYLPGAIDAPALMFCAHLDTIEPTGDLHVQQVNGLLTSDGATILGADDRAGVAAIIELLYMLRDTALPHPPLELVFPVAEEIGVMGSMVLDYALLSAPYGFVADSSGPVGKIVNRAPAQQHLQVTIHGRAAHAGMAPEDGCNAISVAARAIVAMRQGRIDEETTANIGKISGGKATNIVPDTVEIEGEARSRDPRKLAEQVAHMRACFEQAAHDAGATVEVVASDVYPAFNLPDDHPAVQLARRALLELEIPALVIPTGGGSDANFFNAHGIGSVILSAGYEHPHGHNECQDIDQLVLLAAWLYEIVRLAS